jgi:anti-sigma regulatory factor (Ser/Thr protein kinase)
MPRFDVRATDSQPAQVLHGGDKGTLLGVSFVSADADSIRDARGFVRRTLRSQVDAVATVDDAVLIVSELLTNVVLHGRQGVEFEAMIKLAVVEKRLRIEVHDASPLVPAQRPASDDAESGRGLMVVGALAHRWGWEPTADGKFVWCELAMCPEQTPTDRA